MNLFTKFYPNFHLANEANIILIANSGGEIVAYAMKWKNGRIETGHYGNKIFRLALSNRWSDVFKLGTIYISSHGFFTRKEALRQAFTQYEDHSLFTSESFNCIMEGIFYQFNYTDNIKYGEKINDKLPTYVFVGRPSSKEWEEQEFAYQRILLRQLHDYKISNENLEIPPFILKKEDISIFIVSEADAIYAQLLGNDRQRFMQSNYEYSLFINLGYLTTDITVFQGNTAILNESRTIGIEDLDRCILHYIMKQNGIEETDNWNLFRLHNYRKSVFEDNCDWIFRLNGRKILIDEELINQSIETMPVYSSDGREEYRSWIEGICSFFREIKENISQSNKKISRILVAGDTSNIPCIMDWASGIFGVKAEQSNPISQCDCVALGLAHIAEKELELEKFR